MRDICGKFSSYPLLFSLIRWSGSLAYKRLVAKLTKENLWLYILKMLTERPMYAYEISKEIKLRFGFSAATVTVYVILYQMRREGLIQIIEERVSSGKPARKYYEVTDDGKAGFIKGKIFLEDTIHVLS